MGGGLLGLATARALARRGHEVLLLERSTVGHERSGSKGTSRVFRLGYDDPFYVSMAMTAKPMWRELESESSRVLLSATGQLSFGDRLGVLADAMTAAGAPFEDLDGAEAASRVPSIHAGGPALFETESGVLAADQCLDALRHSAESAGARVIENNAVTSVSEDGNRVHFHTDSATVTASVVVLCAGHWTSGLLESAGVGLRLTATLEQVAHLAPVTGNPVDTPVFIERASPWVYGLPVGVTGLLKVALHGAGPVAHPDDSPLDPDPVLLTRLAEHTARLLPHHHVEPVSTERCFYDSTADGDFVLDRVGRIVVGAGTTGHGFKFGPLLGELLADLATGAPARVDLSRFKREEASRRRVTTPALLWAAVPAAADTRHNQRQSPSSRPKTSRPDLVASLQRRTWPICATVVLFCFAMAYFFRWGPTVEHIPLWETPGDLWETYAGTNAAIHGHFGAIYAPGNSFYAFPAIVVLLAPVAALANALGMGADVIPTHIVSYPQAFLLLGPYLVLISAFALFACDALAERLGVAWRSRAVLALAEGVALFNVSVFWGHPEYAIAVGFAIYSLIAAIDGRFTKAGWLLGAAVAFQPLVIVALPILLVLGGRRQALGLVVRGAIPSAVLVIAPLVSNAHVTLHALFDQAFLYPIPVNDHATPWTFLAPKLGGAGTHQMVGGGPIRLVSLLLACGVGWWALRWRNRPEMLVWAFALALALRCYTEPVMTDYYLWPALAVGLVVAARCSNLRFVIAIVAAVVTTITAQWYYSWLPWWLLDVGGITVLLAAAAGPARAPADAADQVSPSARSASQLRDRKTIETAQAQRKAVVAQRKKNKAARASRTGSRRR